MACFLGLIFKEPGLKVVKGIMFIITYLRITIDELE